ncbi:piggyBac transposable element-derived protein 4-like [Melitaea cinxia]|uniref:piggyBac transposable element-derived protein 4-like n=1 Tax=Melitaea cinxia TaxID=113334 RepID=UPI001E26FE49|nr:piggyBac transposable element-derived protein 4-like [Melitaea cinxia]
MAPGDPYEREQKRLLELFNEVETPESSEDPYADDGEYGSDKDYYPSGDESLSSDDAAGRRPQKHASNSSGESSSSSDSDDSEKTFCPSEDEQRNENISVTQNLHVSEATSSGIPLSSNDRLINQDDRPNSPDISDQLTSPISHAPRTSAEIPSVVEGWSDTVTDIPDFNFDNAASPIQVNIDNIENVMDFFHLVFPRNFVEYLVICTNNYGKSLCQTNKPHTRYSRKAVFRETNYEEMLKFLGLSLLKGHIKCPKQRNLFTLTKAMYYHPIFTYTMSGRRYEQLLRCLYASELEAKGQQKIIKFIDMLTINFRKIYSAGENLSLDESLLLFRGRLHFRQYIKSKKARYGIKFYELTTFDGYVLNILMYSGKETTNQNMDGDESKTEKLVLRLMRPYLLRGHHLFMDNYYNSVKLSQKLLDLNTHSTGTLRKSRKDNPKFITTKKLKKGEHVWARKNKVYVSNWKDKRPVLMVTTKVHPSIIEVSNRFGKSRLKPAEVDTYNRNMSGIDRCDQMVSYYSCPRKTIRWYKKVIFYMMDIVVWNAFFLYRKYKKNNSSLYSYINYREELIQEFIGLDKNLKGSDLIKTSSIHDNRRFRPTTTCTANIPDNDGSVIQGHWPEQMPARPGTTKKFAFLKCKFCTQKKIRKETSYRCKGCSDKPPLCPSCFEPYHASLLNPDDD